MTQATQIPVVDNPVKNMTDLVTEIARALVDDPANVSVEAIAEGRFHCHSITRSAKRCWQKLIGKQGRTARSMRTILKRSKYEAEASVFAGQSWNRGDPPVASS